MAEQVHQHQRNAGDDVRGGHGQVGHVDQHARHAGIHGVDADGAQGADDGGDDRSHHGHLDGGLQCAQDRRVIEQLHVPVQGEARPLAAGYGGVEGERDHDQDGRVEEQHQQRHPDGAHGLEAIGPISGPASEASGRTVRRSPPGFGGNRLHHMPPPSLSGSTLRKKPMDSRISTSMISENELPMFQRLGLEDWLKI